MCLSFDNSNSITFSSRNFIVLRILRRSWKILLGLFLPVLLIPLAFSDAEVCISPLSVTCYNSLGRVNEILRHSSSSQFSAFHTITWQMRPKPSTFRNIAVLISLPDVVMFYSSWQSIGQPKPCQLQPQHYYQWHFSRCWVSCLQMT